ncbi:MAG: hypothetical protein AAF290_14275, partial [Pseudomonadota bacterium]
MTAITQHKKMPEQTDPRGNFISTYSGQRFYIEDPNVQDIPIFDIAHALSMKCRFNGHTKTFYSVAEHSVYVSEYVPAEDALWGLLHDISEAFLPDVPRPVKPFISGFKSLERKIMGSAIDTFGLPQTEPQSVHDVDKHIVASEAAVLFAERPDWIHAYDMNVAPVHKRCIGWPPNVARAQWIHRFKE